MHSNEQTGQSRQPGGDVEAAALAEWYDRDGPLAFVLVYRVLADRAVAEDAVREAFLAVWRHAGRDQLSRGALSQWLLAITHRIAIDRRRGRVYRELPDSPVDEPALAAIGSDQLRHALAMLGLEQRAAIEHAYFDGLTYQEIAALTGTPPGTISGRMRLGLHTLRGELAAIVESAGEESSEADRSDHARLDASAGPTSRPERG